eukprot:scaffold443017_cov45-Prasinocladus_malaysianus.AAC.1
MARNSVYKTRATTNSCVGMPCKLFDIEPGVQGAAEQCAQCCCCANIQPAIRTHAMEFSAEAKGLAQSWAVCIARVLVALLNIEGCNPAMKS